MKTVCELNKCNACMACVDVCPKQCIAVQDEFDSFNAIINEQLCIDCHKCEKICPNIHKPVSNKPIEWKQGWANEEIRVQSTSGGAASAIIKSFIQSGGYVASCLFQEGQFLFEITNDLNVAKKFAGSKYVKSNPTGIYKKVEDRLKTNKVLFIGLPCQVAGLKNYIKNQEDLYTVDILCHGTPSIKSLKLFLQDENVSLLELSNIKFRVDKNTVPLEKTVDNYSLAFLNLISCTEGCYSCNYTSIERISDISLGDSWGTEYKEEKNGVSLILILTPKGKNIIEYTELELKDVDLEKAICRNQPLRENIKMPIKRSVFFDAVKKGFSFSDALAKAVPKLVLKQKVKKWLAISGLIREKGKYRISIIDK